MTQVFLDTLEGKLRFDSGDLTFCTHYSWSGVSKHGKLGIENLWLYYNRCARIVSPEFLTFRVERPEGLSVAAKNVTSLPLEIRESDGNGFDGVIAFAGMDILCYHATLGKDAGASAVTATLSIPATKPLLKRRLKFDSETRRVTILTRTPRTDARDPDPDHPLTICLMVPKAFNLTAITADGRELPAAAHVEDETDGPLVLTFMAKAADFKGEQTFVVGVGEGSAADDIETRVAKYSGITAARSRTSSLRWLRKALDKFTFDGILPNRRLHYAKAVYQILSNTKAPRGRLKHTASYPARRVYCTEFLWSACFTSVGVAQFNRKLAEGFLLNICENQEPDGKMPMFVCATWNRPGGSNAPLIGWAAWRLYEEFGNKKLISAVYGPLCRSTEWWFKTRDQDCNGVVEFTSGLECWDDSPRFDQGPIEGVDLNAYLNREMRILAKMANVLGKQNEAEAWNRRAAEHAERVTATLFDPEDELYYDRLVEQKRLYKILTPACFVPLWTGMPTPEKTAKTMISRYLLDPKRLFGEYPFPTVAYDEPTYNPKAWWRGPVWVNIAWLMTETLAAHGFEKERREASKRLLDMMTSADELYELYSSETGKPEGCAGYDWTCAGYMDLARQEGKW